jgi:hypothetical protein
MDLLEIQDQYYHHLHRARKKLKAILEEKCTFEVDERSVLVCEPIERKEGREPLCMLPEHSGMVFIGGGSFPLP